MSSLVTWFFYLISFVLLKYSFNVFRNFYCPGKLEILEGSDDDRNANASRAYCRKTHIFHLKRPCCLYLEHESFVIAVLTKLAKKNVCFKVSSLSLKVSCGNHASKNSSIGWGGGGGGGGGGVTGGDFALRWQSWVGFKSFFLEALATVKATKAFYVEIRR